MLHFACQTLGGPRIRVRFCASLMMSIMDSQLMAQQSLAKSTGVPFNVVVAPNTQVYSSVFKATTGSGGNVYVWNPLTKAFTPYRP